MTLLGTLTSCWHDRLRLGCDAGLDALSRVVGSSLPGACVRNSELWPESQHTTESVSHSVAAF